MAGGKDLGALVGRIGADISQWKRAHKKMREDLKRTERQGKETARKLSKSFDRVGSKLTSVGKSLTRNLTLPLLAAAGAAAKVGVDFEAKMTEIQTLVGISAKKVKAFEKTVISLSQETGQGPTELARALFAVTSAGLRGQKALNVLEKAAKASAIGLGETYTIARALTGILQAYSKEGLTAAEATNTLIGTVRYGNLRAKDLAGTLGRVTGIAQELGVSFADVGASIASFTRLGVRTQEAVIGVRSTLNAILRTSPRAKRALAEVSDQGINTFKKLKQAIRTSGFPKTLVRLVKGFEGNQEALSDFTGRVRALAFVLGTASAQEESFLAISKKLNNEIGLLGEAFATASKTAKLQLAKALASLKTAGQNLSETLIPIIIDVSKGLAGLFTSFTELTQAAQENFLIGATAAAALGPVAWVMGKISRAVGMTIKAISFLAFTSIPAIIGAFQGLNIAALIAAEQGLAAAITSLTIIEGLVLATGIGAVIVGIGLLGKELFDTYEHAKKLRGEVNKLSNIKVDNKSWRDLETRLQTLQKKLKEVRDENYIGRGGRTIIAHPRDIETLNKKIKTTKKLLDDIKPVGMLVTAEQNNSNFFKNLGLDFESIISEPEPFNIRVPIGFEPVAFGAGSGGPIGDDISEAVKELQKKLQKNLDTLSGKLKFPDIFDIDKATEQADIYKRILASAIDLPEGDDVTALIQKIVDKLRSVSNVELPEFQKKIKAVYEELEQSLDEINIKAENTQLWPEFDEKENIFKAKIKAGEDALKKLKLEGVDPTTKAYQQAEAQVYKFKRALIELQGIDIGFAKLSIDLDVPEVTKDDLITGPFQGSIEFYESQIAKLNKKIRSTPLKYVREGLRGQRAEIEKELDKIDGKTKSVADTARKLGFTFTSAFEDAILSSESLGDTLNALLKDIERILLRVTVSKPLGDAFANWLGGSISAKQPAPSGQSANAKYGGSSYITDGLVTSNGKVVKMRPDDNIYAFKDSSIRNNENEGGGGGGVTINVIDKNNNEISTKKRKKAGGGVELDVLVDNKVREGFSTGKYDNALSTNFGVKRAGY